MQFGAFVFLGSRSKMQMDEECLSGCCGAGVEWLTPLKGEHLRFCGSLWAH